MQIKTTVRYHPISGRMAIIKKPTNNYTAEGVEKQEPSYTVNGSANQSNHRGE